MKRISMIMTAAMIAVGGLGNSVYTLQAPWPPEKRRYQTTGNRAQRARQFTGMQAVA